MDLGIQTIDNDGSGRGKHMEIGGNGLECYPLISTQTSSVSLTKSRENFQLEINGDESDVPISSSIESGNIDDVSAGSTSVSDAAHASMFSATSPIQSLETQRMDRPEGYDPFRIPSSVFDRSKSTTPVDWSVASNESLFSIHVGNSSFSRDHFLMLGDLGKSGDLTKSEELFVLNRLPQVPMVESGEKRVETVNESVVAHVKADIIQDEKIGEEHQNERKSDGSGTSAHSFAFPIFEDGKSSVSVTKDEKPQESRVFVKPRKSKLSGWFACFSCCHRGRFGCRSCSSCWTCPRCRSCSCSCLRGCSCHRCSYRRCCCCCCRLE